MLLVPVSEPVSEQAVKKDTRHPSLEQTTKNTHIPKTIHDLNALHAQAVAAPILNVFKKSLSDTLYEDPAPAWGCSQLAKKPTRQKTNSPNSKSPKNQLAKF